MEPTDINAMASRWRDFEGQWQSPKPIRPGSHYGAGVEGRFSLPTCGSQQALRRANIIIRGAADAINIMYTLKLLPAISSWLFMPRSFTAVET